MKQIIFIILGFIIGQGAMFISQSYILYLGHIEIITSVGIGLGLVSLVQWASDGGGVFLLSSQYENAIKNNVKFNLLEFVLSRAIVAFFVIILVALIFLFSSFSIVTREILIFAPVISLIWIFNITSIVDYESKNGIIGPLSNLNWVFSSVVLALAYDNKYVGYYIGAVNSFGLILTIFAQYYILRDTLNIEFDFRKIKSRSFIKTIRLVVFYSISYVGAQGYARIIPILINNFLDAVSAGYYIYAKNIANIVNQVIYFSRRVEFKNLTSSENIKKFKLNMNYFYKQKYSLIISVMFIIGAGFLLAINTVVYSLVKIPLIVLVFLILMALLNILWAISSSMGQILIAQSLTKKYSMVIYTSLIMSLVTIIILMKFGFGVYSIFAAELFMYIVQGIMYYIILDNLKGDS